MNHPNFTQKLQIFWKEILSYFNVKEDLEPQSDTEVSIRSGVSFKGSQLLTLIFAIFIASLGLNTNSIPVIIGAMLISPLMGPIIGMGLGVGIQDIELVRRSLKNISAAVIGSLLASALYFTISPLYDGASQLLARTSPSIYDVFVALFGGAAGILSIASKNKGQVLPGVAIATSLMPPLCTAGYGLATLQMHFFLGALYLFFTNMIFIFFATWIGVKLMGFKKVVYQNEKRARRIHAIAYSIVALTIGVSIYLTVVMVSHNIFLDKAATFVEKEMVFPNTQVLSHKEYMDKGKRYIDVTLIGEALPKDSLQLALMNKLDSIGLGGTILHIKQGFSLNKAEIDADRNSDEFYRMMQAEIANRQITIDSLRNVIASHGQFASDASRIAPEIKVLFPNIRDIACASILATSTDSLQSDTLNIVLVNSRTSLNNVELNKLREYLQVRLSKPRIEISVNPSGIPWPNK
ncbi:MAG: TIGR00341 family protein [Bacteroidales bacterium]|nr:TIGR00341 family protein [Bacteroidales bacterium]